MQPKLCTEGYCELGSPAEVPCPGGTHRNTSLTLLSSVSECIVCPAGTSCSLGSDSALPCAPGTINPHERASRCTPCHAGTFQDAHGGTACKQCTGGNFCPLGASAELPCPAGSYSNSSDLESASQCISCPKGSACPTGARAHVPCAPGTFTPVASQSTCSSCPGGSYQDKRGTTSCA